MKKGTKIFLWVVVVFLILAALWKWVFKTSVIKLANGTTIYKKGGNFYTNTNGVEVKIDQTEYNRLKVFTEGSCTNPNAPQTQSVTACNYFGYKGEINECGDCAITTPITRICDAVGGPCGTNGTLYLTSADAKNCNYSCYQPNQPKPL